MAEERAYKWRLRKGGKKMRCPNCGEMRFVPYVLAEDGKTIATDSAGNAIYGRCDRENNCSYHLYPGKEIAPDAQAIPVVHEEPIVFRDSVVKISCTDTLFHWVEGIKGTLLAKLVWEAYQVGSLGDKTIWWQRDIRGNVKSGKIMEYREDGHRVKDESRPYAIQWAHKSREFSGWYEGKELEQCWFGEHLLERHPEKPVAIVESEKTAVMMSIFSKKYLWLAAGGAQGIKNDRKAKVLEGRDVLLVPDHGKFWEWYNIGALRGWKTFDLVEKHPCFEGCDVLDIVLEMRERALSLNGQTK